MTTVQLLTVGAAFVGALGTALLFFGTYGFEPKEGAVWGGPTVDEWNKKVTSRNSRRRTMQRVGLSLLCMSFLLQGLSSIFM